MTGIFGILESSATQWCQDVAPTQEFLFSIVTSIVYAYTSGRENREPNNKNLNKKRPNQYDTIKRSFARCPKKTKENTTTSFIFFFFASQGGNFRNELRIIVNFGRRRFRIFRSSRRRRRGRGRGQVRSLVDLLLVVVNLPSYPVVEAGHRSVDSWSSRPTAPVPVGHYAYHDVPSSLLQHERAAAVALQREREKSENKTSNFGFHRLK